MISVTMQRSVTDQNNSVVYRAFFDTKVMGVLTDRPSNVIRRFREDYEKSPKLATDRHYKFSQDTDYIRRYRIARDMKWVSPTESGGTGHHDQSVQAGERPESHCSSQLPGRLPIRSVCSAWKMKGIRGV